jgi:hypothetical protein
MTRAKDALVLPVFPRAARNSMMTDLDHLLPDAPAFGRVRGGWLVVDGATVPGAERDRPAFRLRLPEAPDPEASPLAASREAWLQERERAVSAAGTPESVQRPSRLVSRVTQISSPVVIENSPPSVI